MLILLMGTLQKDLGAQQNFPARSIQPDERVTLDSSIPLKTAIDILSQYSMKHEGKLIIDPAPKNTPINVMVNNMYWKRALEYILRSNLLKYEAHERHYEIVPLMEKEASGEEPTVGTTSKEIEINAVFFEADYQTMSQAGVDWSAAQGGRINVSSSFSNQGIGQNTGVNNGGLGGNYGSNTTGNFGVTFQDRFRAWNLFAFLRAVESLNKGEVIANPQIQVLDGEQGRIRVGLNFYLPTQDFAGNTILQEQQAGIELVVTPKIVGPADSAFIHLDIQTERSDVIPGVAGVSKTITQSNTRVLLLSGEETIIAGLFSDATTVTRQGIPILKDLPAWFFGLRYLFGYNSTNVRKKELIIVLQANILPTIAERIAARSLRKKIYIDKKRQEFKRRVRQLKTLDRGTNGNNGKPRRTKQRRK